MVRCSVGLRGACGTELSAKRNESKESIIEKGDMTSLIIARQAMQRYSCVFFMALNNNRGLLNLDWDHHSVSNDNWSVLCESLQAHPTLTILNLRDTSCHNPLGATQKEVRTHVR
jgi:hypothetical protein